MTFEICSFILTQRRRGTEALLLLLSVSPALCEVSLALYEIL
jgi:hypothetical protein